jgi:hypothetical protein
MVVYFTRRATMNATDQRRVAPLVALSIVLENGGDRWKRKQGPCQNSGLAWALPKNYLRC